MIVVVGRPGLGASEQLDRLSAQIALAVAGAGGQVELVGSVGDDAEGDDVVVALGRARIGHAAILRDPAGTTPTGSDADAGNEATQLPRLDAGDIELGLSYLPECQVLIVADEIDERALRVVADAALYHRAELVVIGDAASDLPDTATVLQPPPAGAGTAFAQVVARYAVALDDGRAAPEAWRVAVEQTGWEQATE